MFYEVAQNHHSPKDMAISGPDKGETGPVLKGMGFRRSCVYDTEPRAPVERIYIEMPDGQLLYTARPHSTWADVCKLQQTVFPNGFVVRERNGEVIQTTYKSVTVTEKKSSKKKKKSSKIRWP